MFGVSGEHLLVLAIVLLIFGPRRLPELGNTLGKAIRNFKEAISGIEEAQFRSLEESSRHSECQNREPNLSKTHSQSSQSSQNSDFKSDLQKEDAS